MKDAKTYEKKIRKLLTGMKKAKAPEEVDTISLIVISALEENASDAQAAKAQSMLTKEFVDINELRVAQPSEIVEQLDSKYPFGRETGEQLIDTLNAVFYRANDLSAEFMAEMGKRELRKWLDSKGVSPYVAARLVLNFGGHAIPVDVDLCETLVMDDLIPAETDLADLQGFLERMISQKDAFSAHLALRQYVAKRAPDLAKQRKAAAKAQDEAEKKAAAEAAAQAKAEAKAAAERAKAAAKAAAKAEKKASKKAAAKKTAPKKTAAKKVAKKAAPKASAKKPAAKAASKKGAKKAAKKTSAQPAAKKAAKKPAKKTVKKATKKASKKAARK